MKKLFTALLCIALIPALAACAQRPEVAQATPAQAEEESRAFEEAPAAGASQPGETEPPEQSSEAETAGDQSAAPGETTYYAMHFFVPEDGEYEETDRKASFSLGDRGTVAIARPVSAGGVKNYEFVGNIEYIDALWYSMVETMDAREPEPSMIVVDGISALCFVFTAEHSGMDVAAAAVTFIHDDLIYFINFMTTADQPESEYAAFEEFLAGVRMA